MALLLSTSTFTSNLCPKLSSIGTHPDTVCRLLFTGVDKKSKYNIQKAPSFVSLSVKSSQSVSKTRKGREVGSNSRKGGGGYGKLLSEGRDEDEKYGQVCPGCGIFMQDEDPNLPGYYKKRTVGHLTIDVEDNEGFLDDEDDEEFGDIEGEVQFGDSIEGTMEEIDSGIDWDSEEWESELETEDDDLEELDGFAPAGLGYGNITEEILERRKKKRVSKAERKRMAREAAQMEKEEVTVCARCYSLRNYGQVKNQVAENLIPDFDFERLITTRLMKPTGNADATVVVMVVDCIDFDGSFPKRAANSLFKALERSKEGLKQSKKLPKLVLVATKVDLLPSQVSPTRLDKWVRHRAKANGAPKLSGVYLVSARKDLGVRNLLAFIKELAGPRGNVWVIGAQNAGKSTLINAFAKKEGVKATKLTEAPVPGTTLGILRIGGVLSAKAKMYDTPGLLHPYLLSMRLNRDEQKMVEIRKELQPRSYRIKASIL
nr:GTP-binding protein BRASSINAZOLE INSENSITIVE PALE GREEN 2, chloroplastic [Ipomoea batatas]